MRILVAGCLGSLIWAGSALAAYNPSVIVGSNAQLSALSSTAAAQVQRIGYATPGDSPPVVYTPSGSACSLNAGAGDGGSQVPTSDSKCWLGSFPTGTVDPRMFGADATGATDSSTAISAVVATGYNIHFAPGAYQFAGMTISGNQTITCDSIYNTTLEQNTTSGNFIILSGNLNTIRGCHFQPIVRTTGVQVIFSSSCYQCAIYNYWMVFAYNGILDEAGYVTIRDGLQGSAIGMYGIYYTGTSTSPGSELIVDNVLMNNAYPLPASELPSKVVTWATNTAYTSGAITYVNLAIYQETAATCTSAATGSGPSGYPSGVSPNVFVGTITDGSCTWAFVSDGFIGLINDSWGYSLSAKDLTVLNNLEGIKFQDANSPGSLSYPSFIHLERFSGDHNLQSAIDGAAGFSIGIQDAYASSSLSSNGIQFGPSFIGDVSIIGGHISDNSNDGIFIDGGSNFVVDGATVGSNSQISSGTYNNIVIAAGIKDFIITNNKVGKDLQATTTAGYGVIVSTGSSDYYTVTGNICNGNVVTACVSDGGSGSHKSIPTSGNGANW